MSELGRGAGARALTEAGPKDRRLSAESLMVFVSIPLLVVFGCLAYVIWHQTATYDSVVDKSLAWPVVLRSTWRHIELTVVSAVIVVLVAVPLGIALTRPRVRKAAPAVVGFANSGQAAPPVGLIVLLAIWLGSGFWTAILALSLYAILPVLRNTIVGLEGVDPTLVEAGRGMGMSNGAVLSRIELPLALPVIMAGVRTALVLLVGTATLATFINAGGLGDILTSGITLFRYPVIVWSAILVALLALLIEWLGRVLELVTRPKGV